jgi:hypothetical protein
MLSTTNNISAITISYYPLHEERSGKQGAVEGKGEGEGNGEEEEEGRTWNLRGIWGGAGGKTSTSEDVLSRLITFELGAPIFVVVSCILGRSSEIATSTGSSGRLYICSDQLNCSDTHTMKKGSAAVRTPFANLIPILAWVYTH